MDQIGRSKYDRDLRELIGPKRKIQIPPYLHRLLVCFLGQPGELVPETELFEAVSGSRKLVHTYISELNEILSTVDGTIRLVNKYGKGYRLESWKY